MNTNERSSIWQCFTAILLATGYASSSFSRQVLDSAPNDNMISRYLACFLPPVRRETNKNKMMAFPFESQFCFRKRSPVAQIWPTTRDCNTKNSTPAATTAQIGPARANVCRLPGATFNGTLAMQQLDVSCFLAATSQLLVLVGPMGLY